MAPELHRLGLLTPLDYGSFATYAVRMGHLMIAELAMAEMSKSIAGIEGMLVKGNYNQDVLNPLLKVSAEAAAAVLRIAEQFGMTPAARARIDAAKLVEKQEPNGNQDEEPEEDRVAALIR